MPLKRSGPFFSCTSCFVRVTWDRGNWDRAPWVCGRSGLSLSPHSTCAGTGSWQEKCLAITGRLEGTPKVIQVTQGLPALCMGHICRADAQLAAPGGRKGSPPFPHTFRFLHHVLVGHPSNPSTPSPILFCRRKSPGNTNPAHKGKASQQHHDLPAGWKCHDPPLAGTRSALETLKLSW